MFQAILLIFLFYQSTEGASRVQNALVYLSEYGYLEPNKLGNSSQTNAKTFRNSLKDFQAFAGIPITGKLDNYTLEVMSMPRCGLKDVIGRAGRTKRYVIQGGKWPTKNLRYKITKYSSKLGRGDVDGAIRRAFNLWSSVTDLTFEPTTGKPHIEIRFEVYGHGDSSPFDGPGGTLAHAYFPQYGATHFDDTEPWSIGGRGTDLYQVAAHEFGHALGLSHSQINEALMAPFYKRVWNQNLHSDDISGIQQIYGGKGQGRRWRQPARPRWNFPRGRFPVFKGCLPRCRIFIWRRRHYTS